MTNIYFLLIKLNALDIIQCQFHFGYRFNHVVIVNGKRFNNISKLNNRLLNFFNKM